MEETESSGSLIADWYQGRSVLVTGGTGFMGKVLVEKLLRSCPGLSAIYLLIRPKRGQDMGQRLNQLLNLSMYDEVRKMGGLLSKVHGLEADLTKPHLGLSERDRSLIREEVSVIFHSAATVKFDECLKEAVAINMTATKSILQLALTLNKLEAMVHVSTAYCNCQLTETDEQVYPIERDPEQVMAAVETLDQDLLETLTHRLLGDRPNTYTLTKALAEQIVYQQSGVLPIAIVRPSIVTAGWKEPSPGWIDNLNGPTGMLVGAGKGVLRTLLCDERHIADLIPVDFAINFCIAVIWHTAVTRPNNIQVYHCTSGLENPLRWGQLKAWGHEYILKYPPRHVICYPNGSFKTSRLLNSLANLLFQRLPAYLIDFGALLSRNKPMMVRVQNKLWKACRTLEFFTMREFRFNSSNKLSVWQQLSAKDREIFYFDVSTIDWKSYIESYVLGTRQYIMKEDPATLPQARANLQRMYILYVVTQASLFLSCFWFLFRKSVLAKSLLLSLLRLCLRSLKELQLQISTPEK